MASTVLPNGIIIPEKYSRDWYNDLYHNWQELDNLLGGGANDGTLTIQKNGTTVGTFSANQATDETVNITVPDVNDGTLTIQQNGTTVDSFSANSSTDKTVNIEVPTKTSDLTNDSGFITGVSWNDVADKPSFATVATSGSYNDLSNKPTIPTVNDAMLTIQQNGTTVDSFSANSSTDKTVDITVPTKTSDLTNDSGFITEDTTKIPLAGSNQISGSLIPATGITANLGSSSNRYNSVYTFEVASNNYARLDMCGGSSRDNGGTLSIHGKDLPDSYYAGTFILRAKDGSAAVDLMGKPNGTLAWNGQPIQTSSDQRLKQQISEIDDKLLDAWEDVNLVQFKYNDAVKEKSDNARLHTGYVVQQIDSACKSHGVDISAYGLYCHEEYPQEVEEVEVKQADGTKTKEKKVIREASEHYSLRYTEVYAVECMYLRRCIARLTARIEELEKGNNTK